MTLSLPHLKVLLVHPVKGVKLLWQKVCFKQDLKFLIWSQNENTLVIISPAPGQESRFHSLERWRSQMAHKCRCLTLISVTCSAQGYCHSLCGWDSSLSQVTPCFCQVALTIGQYHFHSLERERYWESQVSCLRR